MKTNINKNVENIKLLLSSADLFIQRIFNREVTLKNFHLLNEYKISLMGIIRKKESIKPLGRWNIESCSKKINNKVDWSNNDHCGPCGQYILSKNIPKTK